MTSPSRSETPPIDEARTEEAAPSNAGLLPNRMVIFVGIFSLILLLSTLFSSVTFRHFAQVSGWPSLVLPSLFTLSFVPAMLLGFKFRHPLLSALYRFGATSLAFLNFALVASIACWVLAGAGALAGISAVSPTVALTLYALAGAVTVYGLVNARWLRITRVTVALPNLPEAWQDHTLALISDVHLGNVRGAGFVRRIVSRINNLKPDAVLIAGDMFDGADVDLKTIAQPWDQLVAPRGVYFSTGNHDEFSDRSHFLTALTRTGMRVVNNEKIEIPGGLQLIGIHDGEAGNPNRFRQLLQRVRIDRSRASILLTHQPSHLAIPEEAGVSLQVSGHTHQGQFWPWTHVVSRVHGRFAYGLQRLNSLQVLTSSGVGTWGPPIRVGTRSEIVLIRLRNAKS
ncbi:MAG: metallophosphoesterase [Rariglobus sp.]